MLFAEGLEISVGTISAVLTGIGAGFSACGTAIIYLWKRLQKVEEKDRKSQAKIIWLESQVDSLSAKLEARDGPDAIQAEIGVDFSGIIREWSPTAVSMFGWRIRQVLGKPVSMVIPERHRPAHQAAFDKAVESGLPEFGPRDVFILARDGSEKPVTVNLSAYRLGDKKIMRALIRHRVEGESGEDRDIGKVHHS